MGRGAAQLGKPLKGAGIANQPNKAAQSANKTGLKPLSRDVVLLEKYEHFCKQKKQRFDHLSAHATENRRESRLGVHRTVVAWRSFMRQSHSRALAIEAHVGSISMQRKSALAQARSMSLVSNLAESDNVHRRVFQSHAGSMERLSTLAELHRRRFQTLFENSIAQLCEEFGNEELELRKRQNLKRNEARTMMSSLVSIAATQEGDSRQLFDTEREQVRNRNLEAINLLRISMNSIIEVLEQNFDAAHHSYMENTFERTREFYELKEKDSLLSKEIDAKIRTIESSQRALSLWRKKLSSSARECLARNRTLLAERRQVSDHYAELNARMNRFRLTQHSRLKSHSKRCRDLRLRVEKSALQAGRIISLYESAGRMETQREKMVSGAAEPSDESGLDADSAVDAMFVGDENEPMNRPILSIDEELDSLKHFHERFNEAVLSRLAAQRQRDRAKDENVKLRRVLKQYLEGINVRENTVDAPNPLLVINGRSGLNGRTRERRLGCPQVVEAVHQYRHQLSHHNIKRP